MSLTKRNIEIKINNYGSCWKRMKKKKKIGKREWSEGNKEEEVLQPQRRNAVSFYRIVPKVSANNCLFAPSSFPCHHHLKYALKISSFFQF